MEMNQKQHVVDQDQHVNDQEQVLNNGMLDNMKEFKYYYIVGLIVNPSKEQLEKEHTYRDNDKNIIIPTGYTSKDGTKHVDSYMMYTTEERKEMMLSRTMEKFDGETSSIADDKLEYMLSFCILRSKVFEGNYLTLHFGSDRFIDIDELNEYVIGLSMDEIKEAHNKDLSTYQFPESD
jgi:hypothetical protein